jgi:hypothetical protein
MKALSGLSSQKLTLLERESEEILGWLKRLTEAKHQEEENANPGPAHASAQPEGE